MKSNPKRGIAITVATTRTEIVEDNSPAKTDSAGLVTAPKTKALSGK